MLSVGVRIQQYCWGVYRYASIHSSHRTSKNCRSPCLLLGANLEQLVWNSPFTFQFLTNGVEPECRVMQTLSIGYWSGTAFPIYFRKSYHGGENPPAYILFFPAVMNPYKANVSHFSAGPHKLALHYIMRFDWAGNHSFPLTKRWP